MMDVPYDSNPPRQYNPYAEEPGQGGVCLGGPAHLSSGPPFKHRRWHCVIPSKVRPGLGTLEQHYVVYEWSDGLKAYVAVETSTAPKPS